MSYTITSSTAKKINNTAIASIYVVYTLTTTDTTFSISGTMYGKLETTTNSSSGITVGFSPTMSITGIGTLTKTLSNKHLTRTTKGTSTTTIGPFTISGNKTHYAETIKISISSGTIFMVGDQIITNANVEGSGNCSINAKTSYPVNFYANGGSGAPAQKTKWHGETLSLTATAPTKSSYTFNGWATSTSNASVGTVNYTRTANYTTNAALNLYAVWELTYLKPTITNLTCERCDSNGVLDDDGECAKISFNWTVFRSSLTRYQQGNTAPYSTNTVSSCTITVGTDSFPLTLTGDAGAVSEVVVGTTAYSTDTAYNVSVSITDSQTVKSDHTTTVTRTGGLSKATFPLDFNSTATAVGFFGPAPDSGGGLYIYNPTTGEPNTINAIINRKRPDSGGWAYRPFRVLDASGSAFAGIGVYGSADTLSYMYLGSGATYDSVNNIRIGANGGLTIPTGGLTVTGVASISSTLTTGGKLTVNSGGLQVVSGNLTVSAGAASISSTLATGGKLTVSNSTNNSGMQVYGSTVISGALTVSGSTTMTGSITFNNNTGIRSKNAAGTAYPLIYVGTSNNIVIGSDNFGANCYIYRVYTSSSGTVTDAANVRITSGDRLCRYASSSIRYKNHVKSIEDIDLKPELLYSLPVKQFRYNSGYIEQEDSRADYTIPGFIVEDMEKVYSIAVDYDDDGNPEDWNVRYLVPPMLELIQEQHEEIEQLKKEIMEIKTSL